MTPDQQALIAQWDAARRTMQQWQDYELSLRRQVVASLFGEYGDGTRSADLPGGYKIANVNTTRFDIENSPEMRELVAKFMAYPETSEVGHKLVTWKPRLSTRAYKALPAWGRPLVDKFVTTTPQLPQLTLTAPRG